MSASSSSPRRRQRHRRKQQAAPSVLVPQDPRAPSPESPDLPSPPSFSQLLENCSDSSASPSPARARKRKRTANHQGWDFASRQDAGGDEGRPVWKDPRGDVRSDPRAEKREAGLQLKRSKEVFVGNLVKGVVTEQHLRDLFERLFSNIPDYAVKYPDLRSPVVGVRIMALGTYAFVEMANEELAMTALKFTGVEMMGRTMQIGRPAGFGMKHDDWRNTGPGSAGLDVTSLQAAGVLPPPVEKPATGKSMVEGRRNRACYFGNLNPGLVTDTVLLGVLTPACKKLPEYELSMGPPIVHVSMSSRQTFCFIEFQSEELATAVQKTFDGMELMGKAMRVNKRMPGHRPHGGAAPAFAPAPSEAGNSAGFTQI